MGNEGVDSSQVKMGFSARAGSCCSNKSFLLAVLGFIFVLLNLAALWALHFADRPVTKGSLRSATRFSTTLGATNGVMPSVGDAVSFNNDNVLRTGAGTTAYLNKLTLDEAATSFNHVNFAPMGTSESYYTTNVMSYVSATTSGSTTTTKNVVKTLSYNESSKTLTAGEAYETTGAVRGFAPLSDTRMVLLTLYVAADWSSYKASVVPATLDGSTGKITLDKTKATDVTTESVTNNIAPLSSTTFVVLSYDKYDIVTGYYQSAKVGSVGTDGTITLAATAEQFGEQNTKYLMTTFGSPLALKTLATASSAGFIIPYFNVLSGATGGTKTNADLIGLCVTSSTLTFSTSTMKLDTFSTGVCNEAYRPGHYVDSVALSDDTMVIIFHDQANSNALTLATVKVIDSKPQFMTSYVLDVSGDFDYGKAFGYSTTPRLRLLSGNRLAVSFLNPRLAGRLSVHVLGYSSLSLTFHEITPILPVALPSFTLAVSADTKTKGAITHDLIPVGSDSFVAAFVGGREDIVHQNFAVVETYTKPVGIVVSCSSSDETSIATQGNVNVDGLTAGEFHYATTSGAIVAKDSTSSDSTSAEYVYAAGNTVLVTTDSRVGMAIDDDTLFVSTAF